MVADVIEAVAVEMMTEAEARDLTERICRQFGQLWELLAIAQDRRAWAALGYASFKEYVEAELPVSRGQAYRLVDQGRVTAELSAAAGTAVTVSARAAAAVKPHLAETAERIREATKGQHEPRRQETVAAIVGEVADHEPGPRESVSRARDTSANNRRSESRAPETSDPPEPPGEPTNGPVDVGAIAEVARELPGHRVEEFDDLLDLGAAEKLARWTQRLAERQRTLLKTGGPSPVACSHPKERRRQMGYGTFCGVEGCGAKLS